MAKLRASTVTLLNGDIRLYQRERRRAWQAGFKVDGRWVRVTTKLNQLADAKERAKELYVEYRMYQKAGLPVVGKRFADVAAYCIAQMEKQTPVAAGKVSYRD